MFLQWNDLVMESWSNFSVLILFTDNSCFSLRLSNRIADSSVQVLVTVVHLSFGWLLGPIINTFTPAKVFTSEQIYHVWFGMSLCNMVVKDITLMIITSLVVLPFLLLYVLLILLYTKKYDVGSYLILVIMTLQEGWEYWFVARLIMLVSTYIFSPYYKAVN